jgi:6-carboxyhexanoate--CoA ligase
MEETVSVRMRASKSADVSGKNRRNVPREMHISGAEGIFSKEEVRSAVKSYLERALTHPLGSPDRIVITIEDIHGRPVIISPPPVSSLTITSTDKAAHAVLTLLERAGVSKKAARAGLMRVRDGGMRGASLMDARTGGRLEPDRRRGVRVSRLGFEKQTEKRLAGTLSRCGINTIAVREAIAIAAKTLSCPAVIGELCISDDPDYTTGYIASRLFGYVRIGRIKRKGIPKGGRVFFLTPGADTEDIIHYLERSPVLVSGRPECRGALSLDEILDTDL